MIMIEGNIFRYKSSHEYETSSLHTPYTLIALILIRIFIRENGKFYKLGWIPLIYHVAMQGTIFNCTDIVANNLSSYIAIIMPVPIPKKNCSWSEAKMLVYIVYQILWAHKHHNFYKLICE